MFTSLCDVFAIFRQCTRHDRCRTQHIHYACQDADGEAASCDIFISYRRKGGSDFAQLLKVCFKSMGLEVFLDVDNLGQVSVL